MRPERLLQLVSDAFACVAPAVGTRDVSPRIPTAPRVASSISFVTSSIPRVRRPRDRRALARRRRGRGVPRAPLGPRAPDRCAKRAHVGHFMADVAVPPEYASDPDVRELLAQCHDLQRRFVEAHKEMEATRASSRDPARLRDRVARLEEEREQLTSRCAPGRQDRRENRRQGDRRVTHHARRRPPPRAPPRDGTPQTTVGTARRKGDAERTVPSRSLREPRLRERGDRPPRSSRNSPSRPTARASPRRRRSPPNSPRAGDPVWAIREVMDGGTAVGR